MGIQKEENDEKALVEASTAAEKLAADVRESWEGRSKSTSPAMKAKLKKILECALPENMCNDMK